MRLVILLTSLILFAAGCAKKDPFTRQAQDSITQPGLILVGVDKESLAFYLNENSIRARELAGDSGIFEIETTDSEQLERAFPNAKVFKDKSFKAPRVDDRVIVELSPREARETARRQLQSLGLQEAQSYSLGEGAVVAVIDSGINVTRYDLKHSIWINPLELPGNKIDDDKNGYVDDVNGWNFAENNHQLMDATAHGTMSAAVIASAVAGIAPKAKVIGLKVIDSNGGGSISITIEAMLYARKIGAHVINLSMGTIEIDPLLHKAINELMSDDIVLVQSAGNMAYSCEKNPSIAALYDLSKFISVGALNLPPAQVNLASYSNYGECVHIAAPSGEGPSEADMFSRGIVAAYPYSPTKFYLYQGTSAAAPVVSGVAALVRSLRPDLSAAQVKNVILNSATQHESLKGRINRQRAVDALGAMKAALAE